MSIRIAIQGHEGSFHQMAAQRFFGKKAEIIPCNSFREVVRVTSQSGEQDAGIMAIENSIAGSILSNYNLLQQSDLTIAGEVYLHIKQHLLVNPGVSLEDIREVHSHTMALQQCYEYLDQFKWKLVETEDTALSARHIHQHKAKHIAAVAGKLAAELFQLDILAPNIHTLKNNYTRFLVLRKQEQIINGERPDKASVNFKTRHTKGSLAKVLTKIADGGINLSKLQSVAIPGSDFRYSFHADMEFDAIEKFEHVMDQIRPLTRDLRVFGIYKKGIW